MDAPARLAEMALVVDRALQEVLPPSDAPPTALHAAMRHLIFPGGKRLRPALAFAGAQAIGAPAERALPMAVAVELIHSYSLIHDDLPCMDDDDLRRGRPTVHVAFGEAVAVLAGDALQALAFEVLASANGHAGRAVALLARACGAAGLVGGQADDLAVATQTRPPASLVESIHARKSAALIAAAIAGGALLAGADPAAAALLERFGRGVGVAFQIADDLLDEQDDRGCSLVASLGAEGARARAADLLDEAQRLIEDWGAAASPLRELAAFAVWRNR